MKSIAITILLVATTCCYAELTNDITPDYVQTYILESGLNQRLRAKLEELKTILKTGDSKYNLPKLDPLELKNQTIDIASEKITIKGQLDNVFAQGLSEYTVQFVNMKLGEWKLSIDLSWKEVRASTEYNVTGQAMGNIPFYGKGHLSADVSNFRFATDIQLEVELKGSNKKVEILEVRNTTISLEKLKMDVTGLLNNVELSEMISKVLSDMAPQFVKDFQEEITTEVNELIKEKGNEYVKNLDLSGIIGGIVG